MGQLVKSLLLASFTTENTPAAVTTGSERKVYLCEIAAQKKQQ